jgi:single-strand DNA-binding protein
MPDSKVHRNEVHLAGELAKDPIIRTTPGGKCVANLTVLTKHGQFAEFHKVVAWDGLAEKLTVLKKGAFVKCVGRLHTRSWDDKQTGQKKYLTEIVAFQLVVPGQEPTATAPGGGTAIARALLSPAETNVHGVVIDDPEISF